MKVSQDEVFRQIYIPSCPICGESIHLAMKVTTDKPGQPSDIFWGPKPSRRRKCQQGAWFHFEVNERGRLIQRLAYLAGKAEPPEQMATEEVQPVQMTLGGGILIRQGGW